MRKPIVTRRIRCYQYTVRCADLIHEKIVLKKFFTYIKHKDNAAALREIERNLPAGSGVKPLAVESVEKVESYRFQTIEEFLQHSHEMAEK